MIFYARQIYMEMRHYPLAKNSHGKVWQGRRSLSLVYLANKRRNVKVNANKRRRAIFFASSWQFSRGFCAKWAINCSCNCNWRAQARCCAHKNFLSLSKARKKKSSCASKAGVLPSISKAKAAINAAANRLIDQSISLDKCKSSLVQVMCCEPPLRLIWHDDDLLLFM